MSYDLSDIFELRCENAHIHSTVQSKWLLKCHLNMGLSVCCLQELVSSCLWVSPPLCILTYPPILLSAGTLQVCVLYVHTLGARFSRQGLVYVSTAAIWYFGIFQTFKLTLSLVFCVSWMIHADKAMQSKVFISWWKLSLTSGSVVTTCTISTRQTCVSALIRQLKVHSHS